MRSLIYTVFMVYVIAVILYFLQVQFVVQLVMMVLLGVGVIFGKFAYDYYQNRKLSDSYLKYAIYSGLAFIIYSSAMFTVRWVPPHITYALYLMALLIFSMIGVNDSLRSMRAVKETEKKQKGILYLTLFAVHGLYAFFLASAFLKGYDLHFLITVILIFDLVVLLPFIIIKKAFEQYLVLGLFVASMCINSYLLIMLQHLK